STSGWVAFGALVAVFVVTSRGASAGRLIVAIGMFAGIALLLAGPEAVADLYEQRVHERMYGERSVTEQEHKDGARLAYLSDNPEKAIVGHGAGGIDFFLIQYVDPIILQRATAITPTYFVPRMVGDLGLIGLGLAALVVACWWVTASRLRVAELKLFLAS